jgi:photosystem II stability/assembly factor-like uncharacterized protein
MRYLKVLSLLVLLSMLVAACSTLPASPAASTQIPPTVTSAPTKPPTAMTQPSETASPTPAETPTITPTPSGAWIGLSPDSGAPGTTLEIDGYLPGGPTAAEVKPTDPAATANVCWQGCLMGFVQEGLPVEWSADQPGHFKLQFTIPTIPWLDNDGPHALIPGDYSLSLQCLGQELEGCAIQEGSVSAAFHLQGPAPEKCQPGQPCSELNSNPSSAAPGTQVQVTGWAPLDQIVDGQPFGYNLAILPQGEGSQPAQIGQIQQDLNGNISGSFTVPQQIPGVGPLQPGKYSLALQAFRPKGGGQPILQATTSFEITSASSWSSLGLGQPLWIQPSANLISPEVSVDPGDAQRLAYCIPNAIRLSKDGGKTWVSIPTQSAAKAVGSQYTIFNQGATTGQVNCLSVTLDAAHPDSFYAVFETTNKSYGAPPIFFMGFVTTDKGKTWKAAPAPSQKMVENFGGFWSDGKGTVQAMYNENPSGPDQAPTVGVEQTNDGGKTWTPGTLICPTSGPCLRWGAAPGAIGGMGADLPQWLYYSSDGGKTWTSPGISVELRLVTPGELVAFSDKEAVLISSGGDFPLRLTQDGGQTWQVVSLPSLPGNDNSGPLFNGLQALPDGSLLAQSSDQAWFMLQPEAQNWCSPGKANLPSSGERILASGSELWWLTSDGGKLEETSLSSLTCGG